MNTVKKALIALTLLLTGLFASTPALAHTEIDHTSPSENSSVAAGTQTVSVVFTDKILNLADSSEIVITDGNGDEVATSCLEVKNTSLNIEAFLGSAGDYKVVWRTVAEDGHPISGKFGFKVTGTADDSAFVNCKGISSSKTPVVTAPKHENHVPETAVVWPYWVVGVLVFVLGGIVLISRKGSKG